MHNLEVVSARKRTSNGRNDLSIEHTNRTEGARESFPYKMSLSSQVLRMMIGGYFFLSRPILFVGSGSS